MCWLELKSRIRPFLRERDRTLTYFRDKDLMEFQEVRPRAIWPEAMQLPSGTPVLVRRFSRRLIRSGAELASSANFLPPRHLFHF